MALIGTASSLAIGTATAAVFLSGTPIQGQVFLGAAITATSVGITARVLKDIGASRSAEARIILGAAVVDDVLALVVLGAVVAWAGAGPGGAAFRATSIVALVMKTVGFLVLAIVLGLRLTPGWAFALALSIAAVVGKISCAFGVLNRNVSSLTVAAGMIPRGEVTLVFAALGSTLPFGQGPSSTNSATRPS